MTESPPAPDRDGSGTWVTVAHHDFGGPAELDATITAALDGDGFPDGSPLYPAVDTEPAERFLASVDDVDASVVFSVADHTVRVSADGAVEVRVRAGVDAAPSG